MDLREYLVLFSLCLTTQGYAYFLTNDIDPIMGYEPDATEAKTYPKREFSHTSMHKKYFTGSNVIKFQKKDHEDIVDSHFKLLKPKTLRAPKEFQYSDIGLGDLTDKNEKMIVVTNAIPPPQPVQVQAAQTIHQQPIPMPSIQTGQQIHSITASPYIPQSQAVQPKPAVQTHQQPAVKTTTPEERSPPNMARRIQTYSSSMSQQGLQLNTNTLAEQKKFIRQNYMPSIGRTSHGRYGTVKPAIERIARHDQMFPKMDYNKDGNFDHDFAMFYRVPSQFAQGNLDAHDYGNGIFVGSYN